MPRASCQLSSAQKLPMASVQVAKRESSASEREDTLKSLEARAQVGKGRHFSYVFLIITY
jgi:hypothetical protein